MSKKSSSPSSSRGTILFVDDEADIRELGKRALEREGHTVLLAENAADAIAQADLYGGTIDLLITDLVMPRMDGVVLSARLAKLRPAMKQLWISAYSEVSSSIHEDLENHDTSFLAKPFSPDDLVQKVHSIIGQPTQSPPRDRD